MPGMEDPKVEELVAFLSQFTAEQIEQALSNYMGESIVKFNGRTGPFVDPAAGDYKDSQINLDVPVSRGTETYTTLKALLNYMLTYMENENPIVTETLLYTNGSPTASQAASFNYALKKPYTGFDFLRIYYKHGTSYTVSVYRDVSVPLMVVPSKGGTNNNTGFLLADQDTYYRTFAADKSNASLLKSVACGNANNFIVTYISGLKYNKCSFLQSFS